MMGWRPTSLKRFQGVVLDNATILKLSQALGGIGSKRFGMKVSSSPKVRVNPSGLNLRIKEYNEQRTHTGKYCYGRTPWETFTASKELALAKMVNQSYQTA
jgi:hypothetical protein